MKKYALAFALSAVMAFPSTPPLYAEEAPAEQLPTGPAGEKARRLMQLKKENPEEFQRIVHEKKERVRNRLQELEEKDPQAYEQAVSRLKERRQERLERMKENRPEEYRKHLQERREKMENRLPEMKEKNPQRYEELLQKRQTWRQEHLQEFRKNHPEATEQFLKNHPDWKERHPGASPDRHNLGVRDHGRGEGRSGAGHGGERRSPKARGAVRGGAGGR